MKFILTGISVMLVLLLIFANIVDYALYSNKRNLIARGIDHSVCAAIQEVDLGLSKVGLSEGYDPETGKILINNILLDEQSAENAFFETLMANTGVKRNDIKENTLIVYIWPSAGGISYLIKKESERYEGFVSSPDRLEAAINNIIDVLWDTNNTELDSHVIHVNGNPSTNEFKKVPYFLVFIKNHEIDGLFKRHSATFIGFAGARIGRQG